MTTTDGHCLAQVTTEKMTFGEPRSWLLPRRALFELKKILETTEEVTLFLGICSNQLVFSGESFNFFTKILVDQFPDYRGILDRNHFQPATIDRSRLLKTLRRSVCLLSNQFIPTKFSFDKNQMNVSMENKEVGSLDEQLQFEGAYGLNIYLYAPFVLNGIQAFSENTISFYLKSGTNPIIFESESPDFKMTYLVMPVSPSSGPSRN